MLPWAARLLRAPLILFAGAPALTMSDATASDATASDATAVATVRPPLIVLYLCTSNVCRSPIAEAIAADVLASRGLAVHVASRGLTDHYSAWGDAAEPRMVRAAETLGLGHECLRRLARHGSRLLTTAEAEDADTVLFLVTSQHVDWTRQAVRDGVVDAAAAAGRLRLVDSEGGDVADPYFGGQEEYDLAAAHLLHEVPITLDRVLRERGILGVDDPPLASPARVGGAGGGGGGGGGRGGSAAGGDDDRGGEGGVQAAAMGREAGARQAGTITPSGRTGKSGGRGGGVGKS